MKLFGLEITRASKAAAVVGSVPDSPRAWFSLIREAWGGAWQGEVEIQSPKDILAFSPVFACVTGIANDISKLGLRIVEEDGDGVCAPVPAVDPRTAVLRKPNHYQTRIQFIAHWALSKLLWGNVYALKQRDARGVVVALYLLDPKRVTPLVTDSGDVYYDLAADNLSGVPEKLIVPASEIIHDRWNTLWHPLVGVSPIYACGMTATMGNKIQANSAAFFANMSAPSGILTAPGKITDEVATRLKRVFEEGFSGKNVGRLFVGGDDLKFNPLGVPAVESQLAEQLKWTAEDVARAFHYPLYKLGGAVPQGASVEALNLGYYSETLQPLIEQMELALDEGLGLAPPRYVEFDLEGLMRMDTAAKAEAEANLVKGGIKAPDEARSRFNLRPVPGGKYPYLQQQNYSLEALAKRDAQADPFKTAPAAAPAGPPAPAANEDEIDDAATAREALAEIVKEALPCE